MIRAETGLPRQLREGEAAAERYWKVPAVTMAMGALSVLTPRFLYNA